VYKLLLVSAPFTPERAVAMLWLIRHVPALAAARENLAGEAAGPFAASALRKLADADTWLAAAMEALSPFLLAAQAATFPGATGDAAAALRGYRDWLRGERPAFRAAARLVQAQGQESPGKIRKPQPPTEVPTTAGASQSI
jgi:hypothetical protein